MTDQREIELLTQHFDGLAEDSIACRKLIETITARIENGELDMNHGNDFLSARNQLLIGYLTNLTKLIGDKSVGKQLESNPVVDRLIQLRVYIEKGQKIYKKMSYQIEKILSFGKNIDDKQNNPLVFKPAPHNLLDLDDEDGDGSGDDIDEEDAYNNNNKSTSLGSKKPKVKSNVYIPPKVAAMMYDDDETAELAKQKAMEKAKKRAMSSNIIQDLRREYDEGPEEITTGSNRKRKVEKKFNEIKEFEEENFIRVTLSKKDKKSLKRPMASSHSLVDEVTNFGDTSFLTSETRQPTRSSSNKSKSIKRKKGGAARRKKFRKFKK